MVVDLLTEWLVEVGEKHGLFSSETEEPESPESKAAKTGSSGGYDYTTARIVHGGGGYVYAQFPDGELVISQGPEGQKDLEVKRGTKAWKAITEEIGSPPPHAGPPFPSPFIPPGPVIGGDNIFPPARRQREPEEPLTCEEPTGEDATCEQPPFQSPFIPSGPVISGDNISPPGHLAT